MLCAFKCYRDVLKMATVVRIALSGLFLFGGVYKITNWLDHVQVIQMMKADFVKFASVFPLAPVGYVPEPNFYLRSVGVIELVLGSLLLVGGVSVRRYPIFGLMFIMAGAVQTLVCLLDYGGSVVPALCFLGLYYVYRNDKAKEKND